MILGDEFEALPDHLQRAAVTSRAVVLACKKGGSLTAGAACRCASARLCHRADSTKGFLQTGVFWDPFGRSAVSLVSVLIPGERLGMCAYQLSSLPDLSALSPHAAFGMSFIRCAKRSLPSFSFQKAVHRGKYVKKKTNSGLGWFWLGLFFIIGVFFAWGFFRGWF